MHFGKRRQSLKAESIQTEPESEPRRRNRLSKPLTSNGTKLQVSTSVSVLNLQVPSQSKNASTAELVSGSPLSPTIDTELRQQIRDELLSPDLQTDLPATKKDLGFGVAYLINQIEERKPVVVEPQEQTTQPEPIPVSPIRPQKRKPNLFRRLSLQRTTSLVRTPSSDRHDSIKSEPTAYGTPNASLDQIVEAPSIPRTRRSSFTPGAATRKSPPSGVKQEIGEQPSIEEVEEPTPSVVETEYFDWRPPSPRTAGRVGTPLEMGYAQLGGLRHGSLQVVNGRASPTFSEASKVSRQLLVLQTAHQDMSSEYGDADDDDAELFMMQSRGRQPLDATARRIFNWERDDDKTAPRIHPLQNVVGPDEEPETSLTQDFTSFMANEYIAEVGDGPFEHQRSMSPDVAVTERPESPVGTIRRTRSEGSLWRAGSCSSMHSSRSVEKDLNGLSPVSPIERSSSPTGSVVRRTSIETETNRDPPQFLKIAPEHEARLFGSAMSWHSVVDPGMTVDEAFQSAIEFPRHPSPSRLLGFKPQVLEKSDSGYSSSNSLRSLQSIQRTPLHGEIEVLPETIESVTILSTPQSSRPSSLLGTRPSILKTRKTESSVPTISSFQPSRSVTSLTSRPPVPYSALPIAEAVTLTPAKAQNKLVKKRRPLSQPPGQISVVSVKPFENDNIPPVSPEARDHLRVRSQAVPELQHILPRPQITDYRHDDPLLNVLQPEIRFPSPTPEHTPQPQRPRSRSRPRSRPRSWFGRSKTELSVPKTGSGMSQADALAIINGFNAGDAGLGRNPYDLRDYSNLPRRSNPSPLVSGALARTRSMMDDETAAEVSRRRSRASQQRDPMLSTERRPSFNDRGGIPGKTMRPLSLASDAPPITAEMLEKAYRTSSLQHQPSPPPRPPPHTSRPAYVAPQEEEDFEQPPPPPPSHSPRPADVSPEEETDPWAAQAAMWKARRKSASAIFRQKSWETRHEEQHVEVVKPEPEPLYPAIPSRRQHMGWTQTLSPEEYSASPQVFHRQYDGSAPQHGYPSRLDQSAYAGSSRNGSRNNSMTRVSQHHGPVHPRTKSAINNAHPNSHPPMPDRSRSSSRNRPHPIPSPSPNATASRTPSRSSSRHRPTPPAVPSVGTALSSHPPVPMPVPSAQPQSRASVHPPPAFGRYSGGMAFGYEKGQGFSGSAGTRAASGRHGDATVRKGTALAKGYGVDLGDVPVGILL